jgi:hypothetical protein
MATAVRPRSQLLAALAVSYALLDLLHFFDHLRQGRILQPQIYVIGTIGLISAFVVAALVLRDDPRAPLLAAIYGIAAGLGVFSTHILPAFWYLSDSYRSVSVDLWSWASAWSLVICAGAMAAVAVSLLVRREA